MKRGKKYLAALEKIEPNKKHSLEDAISKLKEIAFAKFDETVELTMWLGVDPRKADQLVRGTIVLPHGLGGATKRVVVIAQGDKIKEAEAAGADMAGGVREVADIRRKQALKQFLLRGARDDGARQRDDALAGKSLAPESKVSGGFRARDHGSECPTGSANSP